MKRIAMAWMLLALCLSGWGCNTAGDRSLVRYATLPTKAVQASFPADFERVHAACVRTLRDDLGYDLRTVEMDATTGLARINGVKADGASVRLDAERSRDLASVTVVVFAVEAGADEASVDRAREVLKRIEDAIWANDG